jgi:hypothetical protein
MTNDREELSPMAASRSNIGIVGPDQNIVGIDGVKNEVAMLQVPGGLCVELIECKG